MGCEHPDFIGYLEQSAYSGAIQDVHLEEGAPIRMARISQPAGEFPDPAVPFFVIQLVTRGYSPGIVNLGAGLRNVRCEPGRLAISPPHTPTNYIVDGPCDFLVASISSDVVCELLVDAAPGFENFGSLHEAFLVDPLIENLMHRLWQETETGNLNGRLFADAAMTMIVLSLHSRAAGVSPVAGMPNTGLADWRLRRVLEYMRANLERDIALAELSAVAKLSPAHFCRAFRTATGLSPIQKLIAMRMELARELLGDPRMPIIHIAAMCGYESPSRFAKLFRRSTGLSPSAWRAARLH